MLLVLLFGKAQDPNQETLAAISKARQLGVRCRTWTPVGNMVGKPTALTGDAGGETVNLARTIWHSKACHIEYGCCLRNPKL